MRKIRLFNVLHPAIFFLVAFVFFLMFYPFALERYFPFFDTTLKTRGLLATYLIVFILAAHLAPIYLLVKTFPNLKDMVTHVRMDIKYWKRAFYLFFLSGVALYLFIYFFKMGTIPIFLDDLESARVGAKAGLGKYILIGNALISVSLVYRFAIEKFVLNKIKLISILYLLVGVFFVMGIGFRGPAAYLVVSCFLAYLIFTQKYLEEQGISFRYILTGIFFIVFLSLLGYYRHTGELSYRAIGSTAWTTAVNVSNLEDIVYNTDKTDDFYYGQTVLSDLGMAAGLHEKGFTGVILKDKYQLEFEGEGMTITSPGEAYMNFGWFGIVLHALFLGTLAGLFYEIIIRSGKLSWFVILVLFSLNFSRLAVGGIVAPGLFFLVPQLILCAAFIFIAKLKI
ncbi:oligosaccharide repeat unit polymerase [Pricia antarctica]|uniref:Oligosaccharide repeat unit polymerase n=1 Tax=Pricia antarctica TaxID=641691 RepID=A0A1G6X1X0_9FLAO|nr:O-antigen polymerase [Pricia antarctica]SDD71893.1 oligosaccharide repeat unit polymerase [Pricia antarctica]